MNAHSVALKRILSTVGHSIAVAESVTGGNLQALIAATSGASDYFLGGITAYNIDQKAALLKVDRDHAASVNCVSQRVAEEMAAGVRTLFGSDIGLATTGYAEPWPDGGVGVPFAYYAINISGRVTSGQISCADRSRVETQRYIAGSVLEKLVAELDKIR
ncbi:MAG: CinA family protein [Planctomycetales bacterium]|nr:CinA family protein [Planctomycetales bacterium]